MQQTLDIAVIGAGPAGLALALLAAQRLPQARVALYDARPAEHDVSADPRTLALAQGSVLLLQQLDAWPAAAAAPIRTVHVSQAPPTLRAAGADAELRLHAHELGVPQLGAVLAYGQLVAPLQAAWLRAVQAQPQRLQARFGAPVAAVKALGDGVEVDAGVAERFDLAVVAEGGVFGGEPSSALAEPPRTPLRHDYRQTAWVGSVTLAGGEPGTAFERFTRQGPLALLPLPSQGLPGGEHRAALVWCVDRDDDPVAPLTDAQRIAVMQSLLPAAAGRPVAVSPLKAFPLGLLAQRTLVQGRCVRIGNAAQTLHPVAGQGLNLGLRDAQALVAVLRGGGTVDERLRRVEWARAPDRWAMIAATDFLARSFTWRWPGLPALRGLGLAALQAAPPLRAALARRMMFGTR